jgi:hypothetical protein
MVIAGWTVIFLEILLLIIWTYSIFIKPNGTDPAGKGIAIVFLLGLIACIIGGILLIWVGRNWSLILVLIMGAIPLGMVLIGLWKQYGNRKNQ